jgi:hypothetical protein
MKYKLNRQERKKILQKVEVEREEKIVEYNIQEDLDKMVLLTHKLYNHLYSHEQKDLLEIIKKYDGVQKHNEKYY